MKNKGFAIYGTLEELQNIEKELVNNYGFTSSRYSFLYNSYGTNFNYPFYLSTNKSNFDTKLYAGNIHSVKENIDSNRIIFKISDPYFKSKFYNYLKLNLNLKDKKMNNDEVVVYRTFPYKNRIITLCIAASCDSVFGGYSVKVPEDEMNEELGRKIAYGRAYNEKTNFMEEFGEIMVTCSNSKLARRALNTIALGIQKRIETDHFPIKGIK